MSLAPLVDALLHQWHTMISRIGADPNDSLELRLQKTLLIGVVISGLFLLTLWGTFYLIFGEPLAAAIFWLYTLLSLGSLIVFHLKPRTYHWFSRGQFAGVLLLSFVLVIVLGGLANASGQLLWGVLALLGVLIFYGHRQALRWFFAYALLISLSVLLQPYLRPSTHLPPLIPLYLLGLNMLAVSAFVVAAFYHFVDQRNLAFSLLRQEQAKSERLLLNILPPEIAAALKTEPRTIATHFEQVSILFADLVNFTRLTNALSPAELLELLNDIFSSFDSLVEQYRLEKIRTIGDSYMVAAGVPRLRPDHAQVLTRLALAMREYLQQRPAQVGRPIDFRIGINSGSVVAGVIGHKKFQYDLWGDAVNTASRMESHGVAGKIQITRETYELIKDEFICEPRGMVLVKGKSAMETWFVLSEIPTSRHSA